MLRGHIRAVKEFKNNIDEILKDELKSLSELIIRLNQDQLYDDGMYNDETYLPEYAKKTIEIKQAKGQPTDRTTLKDTGDFYKGFYVEKVNEGVKVWSKDEKTNDLVLSYSDDIFGLIPDHLQEVIDEIRPKLIDKLKNLINEYSDTNVTEAI